MFLSFLFVVGGNPLTMKENFQIITRLFDEVFNARNMQFIDELVEIGVISEKQIKKEGQEPIVLRLMQRYREYQEKRIYAAVNNNGSALLPM